MADAPEPGTGPETRDEGARAPRPPRRRTLLLFAVAAVALAADLVSKTLVVAYLPGQPPIKLLGGLVYLVHTRNTGAAFSFAEGQTVLLSLVAVVVVGAIIRFARRLRSVPWAVSLGLILGGALGNLVDRVFRAPGPLRGAVVDWISLLAPDGHVWPIFNLADSSLVVGVIVAVLLELTGRKLDGTRVRGSRGA